MVADNNKDLQPIKNGETAGQISLPFNENQFKDFIVSLLGKPQTITKRFRGSFEINKENLITLFQVLNQRVYQQNDAKLIQFSATIYYDDNSTVTLSGFDHLVNYNESLPIASKAVHLTWQYLIKFRDKSSFERQEISISFIPEMDGRITLDDDVDFYPHNNQVYIRIQHTARTWGADIEGLLSKHIKTIVKDNSKFYNFFSYNPERVGHAISGLLAIITLLFSIYYTSQKANGTNHTSTFWIHHYGSLLFLMLGVYVLIKGTLIILEEFEVYEKPSFVLLTAESFKQKEHTLKSFKRRWFKYLLTLFMSIVIGIVGNYIYGYLTN